MVCVSGAGRIVLIGVNTVSAIIGVALITCGCVIKYVLGDILKTEILDFIIKTAFTLFIQNTPVPNSIDFGPLTDTVGIVLIILGVALLVISFVGCLVACCSFRAVLIAYAALMVVIIVGQVVMWSVFLPRQSLVHDEAKKTLREDLIKDYNRHDINQFTISADIIFLVAECCGVDGPDDFRANNHLRFNFSHEVVDPEIPPSCCQRHYINKLQWDCAKNKTMGNQQGCYEKLQDIVEGWYPWLIPAILIFFAVQIGEIVAAYMIYKDDSNFIV
ncbi:tetraspanin-9-like [Littorina saxatilis]|uniref:tetraspanin-9-like n=1 Tax=Littorina saxatilis TaxID=31220 RepID=UPI0038B4754B